MVLSFGVQMNTFPGDYSSWEYSYLSTLNLGVPKLSIVITSKGASVSYL